MHRRRGRRLLLAWPVRLIIASIPVLTVAFLFRGWIETHGRQPLLIACTSIGFGLLLYWSEQVEKKRQKRRDLNDLGWWDSVVIGLSQALALLPGTSRSGITMTSGLVLGFTREEAARFSFLLAVPVGVAAFLNDLRELVSQGNWQGRVAQLEYRVRGVRNLGLSVSSGGCCVGCPIVL